MIPRIIAQGMSASMMVSTASFILQSVPPSLKLLSLCGVNATKGRIRQLCRPARYQSMIHTQSKAELCVQTQCQPAMTLYA